jgi:alpha-mannosidase
MNRFAQVEADMDTFTNSLFPTSGNSNDLFYFNPLPYNRSAILEIDSPKDGKGGYCIGGVNLPQVTCDGKIFVYIPSVTAQGSIELHPDPRYQVPELTRSDAAHIENEYYHISIANGQINRIASVKNKNMILEGLTGSLLIREDRGGFWTTLPTGAVECESASAESCVESGGPLQRIITKGEIRGTKWNPAILCKWEREVRLWKNEDRMDFLYRIDWTGTGCDLSVSFPVPFYTLEAMYETPFAVWPRPAYEMQPGPFGDNRGGEWPSLRFVSVDNSKEAKDEAWGVSIVHQGSHGIIWKRREFIINLLHSPDTNNLECGAVCWDRVPVDGVIHDDDSQERGTHEFSFSLRLHQGNWKKGNTLRLAETVHAPLLKTNGSINGLALEMPSNAGYSALKPSDDGTGIILRLWEAGGEEAVCSFGYAEHGGVYLCGLNEDRLSPLRGEGGRYTVKLKPYEIVSVFLEL